jgi:hypothetical protein
MKLLLSDEVQASGGNAREAFEYDSDERVIYKFSNPSQDELRARAEAKEQAELERLKKEEEEAQASA